MRCWIEYQPSYNAVVTLNPYALDAAKAIDNRLGFGEKLGSLAGVPIVIKEPIDIARLPPINCAMEDAGQPSRGN
ncbi:MAG: hypothetical protein EOS81_22110 [Mesorhizobium sp.]|uniref:amidase family protein n=1 Tax=Mesorhizobium sp. TaxID=1871066 RepID=UPI000FE4FDF7|nr:MAG: hypothetical protein EOS81_22110 [Mesorhizobium sp.]